jgi:hypothetical protein|tara:strand:- start:410 stop:841 length:432 start_codon:yes stop_codon:yes gene_type:complete
MAISQAMATSFKVEILGGDFDFSSGTGETFKIALFTSSATLGATTTAYATTNEVVGTGYTAGGNTLTISANPASTGTTAFLDFADTTWSTATITARGALIYKSGGTNPAIAVLDFGSDKTSTAGDFTIVFPAADASNAIIRIA